MYIINTADVNNAQAFSFSFTPSGLSEAARAVGTYVHVYSRGGDSWSAETPAGFYNGNKENTMLFAIAHLERAGYVANNPEDAIAALLRRHIVANLFTTMWLASGFPVGLERTPKLLRLVFKETPNSVRLLPSPDRSYCLRAARAILAADEGRSYETPVATIVPVELAAQSPQIEDAVRKGIVPRQLEDGRLSWYAPYRYVCTRESWRDVESRLAVSNGGAK